jgi:hypothetical protein
MARRASRRFVRDALMAFGLAKDSGKFWLRVQPEA